MTPCPAAVASSKLFITVPQTMAQGHNGTAYQLRQQVDLGLVTSTMIWPLAESDNYAHVGNFSVSHLDYAPHKKGSAR